jgi:MFS family permease
MLAGGWGADRLIRRREDGRMLVAAAALFVSAPASLLALLAPSGAIWTFMLFQALSSMMMYVYYATVYSTIHDIIEPALRGTAMALYFFAMYVLGASFGPIATGWLSDHMARGAALAAGVPLLASGPIPEQFRAIGLHQAMYVLPVLGALLAAVLYAASRTVRSDARRLQEWMRSTAAEGSATTAAGNG